MLWWVFSVPLSPVDLTCLLLDRSFQEEKQEQSLLGTGENGINTEILKLHDLFREWATDQPGNEGHKELVVKL